MFALTLAALVVAALLAGVHIIGVGGLNPAMHALDGPAYLAIKHALDREMPTIARPLMLGSLTLTAVTVVVAAIAGHPAAAVLGFVALLALAATLVAILRGDLPLNRQMASWTPTSLPNDWTATRTRWESFFAVRVATSGLAVVLLAAAAIVVR